MLASEKSDLVHKNSFGWWHIPVVGFPGFYFPLGVFVGARMVFSETFLSLFLGVCLSKNRGVAPLSAVFIQVQFINTDQRLKGFVGKKLYLKFLR